MNKSNNCILNKKEKNKFHKIIKSNNAIKLDEKNRNKLDNFVKFRNKDNNINIFNYKTMNNDVSLIKNKNFQKLTNNNIKFKARPKNNIDEKTFTKINKNKIINRNRDNKKEKEKNLMPKIKSQKIMNVILNKRNSKSIKDNKTILALNNIISNNENEPYINKNNYIHNITYNEQENKTQIIRKQNNYTKITPQKKEKLRNYSEKYKEKKLFKKQNFSAVKIININNFNVDDTIIIKNDKINLITNSIINNNKLVFFSEKDKLITFWEYLNNNFNECKNTIKFSCVDWLEGVMIIDKERILAIGDIDNKNLILLININNYQIKQFYLKEQYFSFYNIGNNSFLIGGLQKFIQGFIEGDNIKVNEEKKYIIRDIKENDLIMKFIDMGNRKFVI
jgi:hypothetical protein